MRDGIGSKYLATYLVKGSTAIKITEDAGVVAWSPDGSQFVLTAPSDKRITFFDSMGIVKHSFNTTFVPTSIDWYSDGKKIIYVDEEAKKTRLADIFHLMAYDILSKTQTEVLLLENDQTIFNVYLAPNNERAAMTIGSVTNPNIKNRVSVFNLEDKSLKDLSPNARVIGWFPDGVNIAVTTNTKPDGVWIGSPHGVLAMVNVETGEFKIIKEQKYEAWDQKLSKDGKYTVYSNSVPSISCHSRFFSSPICSYSSMPTLP